jgi:hypothetical protein
MQTPLVTGGEKSPVSQVNPVSTGSPHLQGGSTSHQGEVSDKKRKEAEKGSIPSEGKEDVSYGFDDEGGSRSVTKVNKKQSKEAKIREIAKGMLTKAKEQNPCAKDEVLMSSWENLKEVFRSLAGTKTLGRYIHAKVGLTFSNYDAKTCFVRQHIGVCEIEKALGGGTADFMDLLCTGITQDLARTFDPIRSKRELGSDKNLATGTELKRMAFTDLQAKSLLDDLFAGIEIPANFGTMAVRSIKDALVMISQQPAGQQELSQRYNETTEKVSKAKRAKLEAATKKAKIMFNPLPPGANEPEEQIMEESTDESTFKMTLQEKHVKEAIVDALMHDIRSADKTMYLRIHERGVKAYGDKNVMDVEQTPIHISTTVNAKKKTTSKK